MKSDSKQFYFERYAMTALVGLVIGAISWAGWVTIELHDKVKYADLKYEIRQLQSSHRDLAHKIDRDFSKILQGNTAAIIQLREQLKYNTKILEQITKRQQK